MIDERSMGAAGARKRLGKTDLEVTQIGFGSMGLRGPRTWGQRVVNDEAADKFLNAVLDAGINFIDTAPDYGACEERIGRFIGGRRNEYWLATKCGCDPKQHADYLEIAHRWNRDTIERNLETSLTRLRTDHSDLLQFHGGDAQTLVQAGLIAQLEGFRSDGRVRYIGVSSSLPNLPGMIELRVFDTFQIPYSCLAPQHEPWIMQAAATGAGVILRGGIAHGGPDAEIERPELNAVWQTAQLDELLPPGVSRAELILRYTLTHPHCDTVIVGTCNHQHLAENLAAAAAGPLPLELYQQITDRVARVQRGAQ